jgi:hypothetical protein
MTQPGNNVNDFGISMELVSLIKMFKQNLQ